jgi:hypothetical protein
MRNPDVNASFWPARPPAMKKKGLAELIAW